MTKEPATEELPLVSVIIPFYNGMTLLFETLNSLRAQTDTNLETILVDDGSQRPIDESLSDTYQDLGLKIIRQKNQGPGIARLRGLSDAKGAYLQFLDQDDLLSPDKIRSQVEYLERRQDVDVVYTDSMFLYGNELRPEQVAPSPFRDFPSGDIAPRLLRECFLSLDCALFRTSNIREINFADIPGNRACNDWHFWLQLTLPGRNVQYLETGQAYKRIHPGCTSQDSLLIVEWRCRIFEWLEDILETQRADRIPAIQRALMDLEWAKDSAVLGNYRSAYTHLRAAFARSPRALLRRPSRPLITLLLAIPVLRTALLRLRDRRDPYLTRREAPPYQNQ